jgi:hypothetical protein
MARCGVYCLANDCRLNWLVAFLQSLRTYNPSIELIIIPFDRRIDRLAAWAPKYDFVLLDMPELFDRIDGIGRFLSPGSHFGAGLFRKFATFYGPFDHFLFLDSDVVILSALDLLIHKLIKSRADFIFFDSSVEWVYADLAFRDYMEREFGSRGFAAGSFVSSKGFVSIDEVSAACRDKERHDEVFCPQGYDQSYLNYVIDHKRAKVSAAYEIIPELTGTWAGDPVDFRASKLRRRRCRPVTRQGRIVPFLHWAGFQCNRDMPNLDFYLHFRLQAEQSWLSRMSCRYEFRHW